MMTTRRSFPSPLSFPTAFIGTVILALLAVDVDLRAQAVKGGPAKGAPRRQVTYRGISPGLTSMEEVREKIGKPVHRAKWYAWKLLYEPVGPAAKRVRAKESGLFDSFHLLGSPEDGHIGTIEAVSVPDGYETEAKIRAKLGDPELKLTHAGGQVLLDYSSKGVRFTLDPNYRTIGTAYFPHGYSRVHDGCRREIDLSHLRQGPTLRAKNPPKPNLKAGAAEIDISPTDPKWFKDEFTIHDAMKARCVVFERDGQKVAIVGADLFGMLKSEFDPIEAELKKKVGLTALIVGMSHNHAAPDTIGIYGYYPKDYVAHIQTQIEKVVTEALAKLEDVEEVAVSSDELLLTGARVHGLMRNARNPGIVDPQIALVEARGKGGKPIATLLHFACHPEGLEKGAKEISADFPGYLCERWKKETGAQAIFLNGALGGMVSGEGRARLPELCDAGSSLRQLWRAAARRTWVCGKWRSILNTRSPLSSRNILRKEKGLARLQSIGLRSSSSSVSGRHSARNAPRHARITMFTPCGSHAFPHTG